MFPTKEQIKIPEEEQSEVETDSLYMRMSSGQRLKRWSKILGIKWMQQNNKLDVFNRKLENKKNSQMEMKNTISDIKNTLEGIKSRLSDTEEWISS